MADFPMDSAPEAGKPRAAALGALVNWAGALVSLALIVGVGVWGYKLLMRDVTGIPVVRATEGPMRVAPENPGGEQAAYQGLAVNHVAGLEKAEPPAERLVLAPEGVKLAVEDVPVSQARADALARVAAARPAGTSAEDGEPQALAVTSLADQIAAETVARAPFEDEESSDSAMTEEPGADPAPEAAAAPAEEDDPAPVLPREGLWKSPRPEKRPAGLQVAALAPQSAIQEALAADAPATATEIDAATLPAGTRLAQLGAFDSAETAREEWDRLRTRFDVYMDGKARVIQKATSGGRTFYRLRVQGFEDLADARRFCSAFVAERVECIPVVLK